MSKSNPIDNQKRAIVEQIQKALNEPLPTNGLPHVIVVVYNKRGWTVSKAAPKGAGKVDRNVPR